MDHPTSTRLLRSCGVLRIVNNSFPVTLIFPAETDVSNYRTRHTLRQSNHIAHLLYIIFDLGDSPRQLGLPSWQLLVSLPLAEPCPEIAQTCPATPRMPRGGSQFLAGFPTVCCPLSSPLSPASVARLIFPRLPKLFFSGSKPPTGPRYPWPSLRIP